MRRSDPRPAAPAQARAPRGRAAEAGSRREARLAPGAYRWRIERPPLKLIEFPADEPERALRFWHGLLGAPLEPRTSEQGDGWQSGPGEPAIGIHARGRGPGDTFSLPYFEVDELAAALESVTELGGSVIHPGTSWAVCKDTEGTPFGLAARSPS